MSKYGVISGPYFTVFGLNTEIYFINLRIQSKYRKIWTRNNSVFGHFSRSGGLWQYYRDEPTLTSASALDNFPGNKASLKFKQKMTGSTGDSDTKAVKIVVSLKYISNL